MLECPDPLVQVLPSLEDLHLAIVIHFHQEVGFLIFEYLDDLQRIMEGDLVLIAIVCIPHYFVDDGSIRLVEVEFIFHLDDHNELKTIVNDLLNVIFDWN